MIKSKQRSDDTGNDEPPRCGIVMPISELDGCPKSHWQDVYDILSSSAEKAGFEPLMVSSAADVGVIQKNIVQNLYDCPIVVCDVSGRNANVMFELGMRLAFDKPVIIIKDDKTKYSFDTSPVEHIIYPRDLRYAAMIDFQKTLSEKIQGVYRSDNKNSFLKSFGTFKVAELDKETVPEGELILEELRNLRHSVRALERRRSLTPNDFAPRRRVISPPESLSGEPRVFRKSHNSLEICLESITPSIKGALKALPGLQKFEEEYLSEDHAHLVLVFDSEIDLDEAQSSIASYFHHN